MHQSIPAVPGLAIAGHLLTLSVPAVGHSRFYRGQEAGAFACPGATPGNLTHVFSQVPQRNSSAKTRCLLKIALASLSGTRQTS